MVKVDLVCSECGSLFSARAAEHTRRVKQGATEFYCGKSCAASYGNRICPRGNLANLQAGNKRDSFTQFRWFLLRAKSKNRRHHGDVTITVSYLADLWQAQEGRCPLTGWQLVLPDNSAGWSNGASTKNASLDRIDCRQGYVVGNVRFVSVMANIARSVYPDDALREFCAAVASNLKPV